MAGPTSALAGMEVSAISILTRAVELDKQRRFTEATICYQEGLQLLMDVIKATTTEPKKTKLREKALEYMDRAEKIKDHVDQQKEAGKYHEQIHIANNSCGNSYAKIFGPFLNEKVTKVNVEDPYIRSNHQMYNFLRFCELLVKTCSNLKHIALVTTLENGNTEPQIRRLEELKRSLQQHHVILDVAYSETLHDREIRGKGLDRPTPLSLGFVGLHGNDIFVIPKVKLPLGGEFHLDDVRYAFELKHGSFNSNQNYANIHKTINLLSLRLNNGWIIKIGRGLDYFKAPEGKFCIGYFDQDLRHCHETTVDIFHNLGLLE